MCCSLSLTCVVLCPYMCCSLSLHVLFSVLTCVVLSPYMCCSLSLTCVVLCPLHVLFSFLTCVVLCPLQESARQEQAKLQNEIEKVPGWRDLVGRVCMVAGWKGFCLVSHIGIGVLVLIFCFSHVAVVRQDQEETGQVSWVAPNGHEDTSP